MPLIDKLTQLRMIVISRFWTESRVREFFSLSHRTQHTFISSQDSLWKTVKKQINKIGLN